MVDVRPQDKERSQPACDTAIYRPSHLPLTRATRSDRGIHWHSSESIRSQSRVTAYEYPNITFPISNSPVLGINIQHRGYPVDRGRLVAHHLRGNVCCSISADALGEEAGDKEYGRRLLQPVDWSCCIHHPPSTTIISSCAYTSASNYGQGVCTHQNSSELRYLH